MSDEATVALTGEPSDAPPPKSLQSLALRGVAWTLAGDGGSHLLRFVSNLVLTRLLVPDVFGIMVIVNVVQTGLYMFSDVGIHPVIVQHKKGDDPAFLDTAWTLQAIRGFLLWVLTWILAWPVASYAHEPLLIRLLPVVGINSLLDGFLSTKVFTSDRHLSLGRLTLLNLGTATVGVVVRIAWAAVSPTVWSMVFGALVGTFLRSGLSHGILPGRVNRFRWDRESLRELVRFGRWVFLSTILTFVAMQIDKIYFVKLIPLAMLGIYHIGSTLCRLPVETVQKIASAVAFPAFSRLRDRQGEFGSAYARVRAPLLVGSGAALAFLTLGGPLVARILYPAKYHDAGWIMQIVAVGLWFQALESTNGTALMAMGLPKWLAVGNLLKILTLAIVLPLSYRAWGFPGALAGMAVVEIPKFLIEAWRVRRSGLSGWGVEVGLTLAVLACASVAVGLHFWTGGSALRVALASACFLLVWLPLALWARRKAMLPI